MHTKTKTALLTAAALLMTAGAAMAAPRHNHDNGKGVNAYERAAIARSAANLAALKRKAWRDGRITFMERFQINNAERRHAALVQRARRT